MGKWDSVNPDDPEILGFDGRTQVQMKVPVLFLTNAVQDFETLRVKASHFSIIKI
jgi:hypothetical protein